MSRRVDHCFSWDQSTWTVCALVLMKLCVNPCISFPRFDYPCQFNQPLAISDDLQLPYTMDPHQMSNPYQATVFRTDVNRSLTTYIPDILEESILVMDETFKASEKQGRYLFSRISIIMTFFNRSYNFSCL